MSKRRNLDDDLYGDRSHRHKFGYAGGGSLFKNGRCYEKHQPLKLPNSELVIYGGSCSNPVVHDADVYIGFDSSMQFSKRHWPWKKGTEFLFKINDQCAPSDPVEFKKMVDWTIKQLKSGLKVHCGCIGGHGRTGTFFAAIVAEFGEKDAINYVQKHYCHKAVESSAQVKFLVEHYGVEKAEPRYKATASVAPTHLLPARTTGQSFNYLPSKPSIWG